MKCNYDTALELETISVAVEKIERRNKLLNIFLVATGVSISLAAIIFNPLLFASLISIPTTKILANNTYKEAVSHLSIDYLTTLGKDSKLKEQLIPPTLLSVLNTYVWIGANSTFKHLYSATLTKPKPDLVALFLALRSQKVESLLDY